jgi:hypothetical protein
MTRALIAALVGALSGAVCLLLLHQQDSKIAFDLEHGIPAFATGLHDVERDPDGQPFSWTGPRVSITIPGLDRRVSWACSARLRDARPHPAGPVDVAVSADGIGLTTTPVGTDFEEVQVTVPPRRRADGLALGLAFSPTFVPGGGDTRELGLLLSSFACTPQQSAIVLPSRPAITSALVGGAAAGLVFVLAGAPLWAACLGALGLSAVQSWLLVHAAAQYTRYPALLVPLALALLGLAALLQVAARFVPRPISDARASVWSIGVGRRMLALWPGTVSPGLTLALSWAAAALYLQMAALLHPEKLLVDALFHAHRFEWVMAGRFYFTQLSTSSTPFPYAIGLYVFAAPWGFLFSDHVTVLRAVVIASQVASGLLLYVMLARCWRNPLAGGLAIALFTLIPLWYTVVGNANLTNAFGQSASLAAVAGIVLWADRPLRAWRVGAMVLLVTLGLVSHISTLVLLLGTLGAMALLYAAFGGQALRPQAVSIVLVTVLASLLAVLLYYGHFPEVYRTQFARLGQATQSSTPAPGASTEPARRESPQLGEETVPLHLRAREAGAQTLRYIGWPILALAVLGMGAVRSQGRRDRLTLVVGAWALTWMAFVAAAVVIPADKRYQQDAWEFISRVELSTCPAAVILAAEGASWAWRRGRAPRVVAAALLLAAFLVGARAWVSWV